MPLRNILEKLKELPSEMNKYSNEAMQYVRETGKLPKELSEPIEGMGSGVGSLKNLAKINALKNLPYYKASGSQFNKAIEEASRTNPKILDNLSRYSPEELEKMNLYLSPDMQSGYALKDKDELVNLFSGVKGRGNELVESAIDKGAKRLDHFEGYLSDLYKKHGFEELKREPNWTPGSPDVIWRVLKK